MDRTTENGLRDAGMLPAAISPDGPAPLDLDAAEYMDDLNGFGLTEAQKTELLETLWSIMGSFARMGFSVDVCGLIFDEFNEASAPESGDGTLIASTGTEPTDGCGGEGNA